MRVGLLERRGGRDVLFGSSSSTSKVTFGLLESCQAILGWVLVMMFRCDFFFFFSMFRMVRG